MRNSQYIITAVLIASGISGFLLSVYFHPTRTSADIAVMQTFHYPTLFVNQLRGDPDAGKKIFKEYCSTCHAESPKIEIHAPKIRDKATWNALRQQGMHQLINMTIRGMGAMPSRGGCFECSDAQLKETIEYILRESQ